MQFPKVLPEFLLFLRTNVFEILATEHHDAPLRNKKREFVLLRAG
jgi:hypothetical protein